MRILDADQMRSVDRLAIEEWGFPGLLLMENAALGVVEAVAESFPEADSVAIFCGPGNNGGDGLAIGRHLDVRGYRVQIILVGWSGNKSSDAAWQHQTCVRQGIPIREVEDSESSAALGAPEADLWIDALFGTGLRPPLRGLFAEFAELLARDALHRTESCGGHFREESQTPDGEALRDDENFAYAAAWEFRGVGQAHELHKEQLVFENVKPSQRSYK